MAEDPEAAAAGILDPVIVAGQAGPVDRSIDGYVEPGKTTGELPVKILDDKLKEPAETFTATITKVDGANLKVPTTLTATITDND